MNWDTAMPANLGYIASILWNQNNCAGEGGPVTTTYEVEACDDLCEMIGLDRNTSMGHLVTGGSVANIEAIWVARNLKYYPLGLQEALMKEDQLTGARGYEVKKCFIYTARSYTFKTLQGYEGRPLYSSCMSEFPHCR